MSERKGTISVQTADIFPIIKKWLYSEHDIFLRELVSNSTDAITKRAAMARTSGDAIPEGSINVTVNKDAKTIVIADNGIGMTEEEVEKYIAQLAFSGAREFVEKMQKSEDENNVDIIGKFGLGFYSCFMVADKVEVESLSMNADAKPTKWICEGETEYTFTESSKEKVGTTITLHVSEDCTEFLNEFKLSEVLRQYCDFMPYPIGLLDELKPAEKPRKEDGTIDEDAPAVAVSPTIINETNPLWKRDPSELKDEDYKGFYRKMFPMDPEPLFWIHLKVDHPFTLEGILFFPKINPKKPFNESNIRLYSKQVFVSDNVKNVIPEFLSLLKGTIDSVDIPLNVSRSSLQGDPNIKKISNYIIKKVGDALKKLSKNERERYESIWEDIGLFIKYGCVSDNKFDELMRKFVIFPTGDKKHTTMSEYREAIPENFKEKVGDKILYVEKGKENHSLMAQLTEQKIPFVELDEYIDPHFIQHVETHKQGEEEYKFSSVDMEIENILETENTSEDDIKIKELFQQILIGKTEENKDDPTAFNPKEIELGKIKGATSPAYFKVDEQMKRFSKMADSMGQGTTFPIKKTLVINPSSPLVQNAYKLHTSGNNEELAKKLCHHIEDLANISSEGLKNENKEDFINRTQDLMKELSNMAVN